METQIIGLLDMSFQYFLIPCETVICKIDYIDNLHTAIEIIKSTLSHVKCVPSIMENTDALRCIFI